MNLKKEEYQRVLSNPDNLILSDDLQDLLSSDNNDKKVVSNSQISNTMMSSLHVLNEIYECKVIKVTRLTKNLYGFKIEVPSFPVEVFIEGENFTFSFHENFFSLEESPAISFRDDGILTFTARRIINNEEV